MIGIVTDSTCDLPQVIVDEYGIQVVPLYINFGQQGYLDGVEISRQEFYRRLPDARPLPSTAAPSPERFCMAFNALADQGATEILSIHISGKLSATVNTARVCAESFERVPVTVFDSRQLSLGTGWLVMTAARAAREGRSLSAIIALLEEQIPCTYVFAALDTLEFLRRSGRMSWAVASLGTLLQIKPLLWMHDGNPKPYRVRTRAQALKRLIQWLSELTPLEKVAIVHTHVADKAEHLRQLAQDLLPPGDIPSVDITPVIGTNIGPGAVGFACITARK